MEFWITVFGFVEKRRWELIFICFLLALISIMVGAMSTMVPTMIRETTREVVKEELAPLVLSNTKIQKAIGEMNERDYALLLDGGMGAYKKFDGLTGEALIDKVESSSQNAVAAKHALQVCEVREHLRQLNPVLTAELIAYWQIPIQ